LSLYFAVPLAACVSLLVLTVTKKKLNIMETFPELHGLPFAKFILT